MKCSRGIDLARDADWMDPSQQLPGTLLPIFCHLLLLPPFFVCVALPIDFFYSLLMADFFFFFLLLLPSSGGKLDVFHSRSCCECGLNLSLIYQVHSPFIF